MEAKRGIIVLLFSAIIIAAMILTDNFKIYNSKECQKVCEQFGYPKVKECKTNSVYCIKTGSILWAQNNSFLFSEVFSEINGTWRSTSYSYEYIGSHEFIDLI